MSEKQTWFSNLKTEFENSPLVSRAALGLILTACEKVTDEEFACPCMSEWNAPFAAAFFVVPAVLIFVLMNMRCCKSNKWKKNLLFGFIDALVWVALVFMDGNYFVCAMTTWSGEFMTDVEGAPQTWCKPDNETLTKELMMLSQRWYSLSQGIGLWFIMFIAVLLGIYQFCKKVEGEQEQTQEGCELTAQDQKV
ncbi:calcium homeostasis modulator protein 6-like [Sparus aurata]|uniref:calcium homeostasis modulator protein 6-like n=1 Tax=Sparus aurata TaxID=8175 RepID=UPI0011C0E3D1|nr:calcium homeostasis modulator protein 6-like [Sparus aurata]